MLVLLGTSDAAVAKGLAGPRFPLIPRRVGRLASSIDVSLEGTRSERAAGVPENALTVSGAIAWQHRGARSAAGSV